MPASKVIAELLKVINIDLHVIQKCLTGDDIELQGAAYHCQQAAEKIIKALLIRHRTKPLYTHDLSKLLAMLPVTPEYSGLQNFEALTQYNTLFRYPLDEEENMDIDDLTLEKVQNYLAALQHYRNYLANENN